MKYKLTALTLILALSTVLISPGLAAAQAGNAQKSGNLVLPISGTATDKATGAALNLAGTFNLKKFVVQDGKLVGIGTLVATVTDPAGGAARNIVVGGVALPVQSSAGALAVAPAAVCDILHLVLGPLHLDLLGLVIDLNQVVLDITAQSGAGNLLGNLLCAVTNLLNQGGPLQGIANLLNQILQILGG